MRDILEKGLIIMEMVFTISAENANYLDKLTKTSQFFFVKVV